MVIEPVVPKRPAPWLWVDVIIGDPVIHGRPGPLNTANESQFSGCAFWVFLVRDGVFLFDQNIQVIGLIRQAHDLIQPLTWPNIWCHRNEGSVFGRFHFTLRFSALAGMTRRTSW